jgi:hypothetical protein
MKPAMTAIEKGIEYIRAHGSARSPELAKVMGTKEGNVQPMLAGPIEKGYLIACKVEKPGNRPTNEYRLSAHVSETKQTWAEFKESNRVSLPTKALKIPKARPPRVPYEGIPASQPSVVTEMLRKRFADEDKPATPESPFVDPIPVAPSNEQPLLFMIDTTGRLRMVYQGKTTILSGAETLDLGKLMGATTTLWSK